MKHLKIIILSLIALFVLAACSHNLSSPQNNKFTVIAQDMPYPTDQYIRIGYTLKMWEYEKEGLDLQQIDILDGGTRATLFTIGKKTFPKSTRTRCPPIPITRPTNWIITTSACSFPSLWAGPSRRA